MTSKKVESGVHSRSWDCGNIRFQIMFIRVLTDNPKHLSKGEYSSRFPDSITVEHGVSNPSNNRMPCLRIKHFSEKPVRNIFFLYISSQYKQ